MRVSMKYNDFTDKVVKLINSSRSQYAKDWGAGIAIGLEILSGYLRDIAQRAIEIQDRIIIDLFKDLGIIIETEDKT